MDSANQVKEKMDGNSSPVESTSNNAMKSTSGDKSEVFHSKSLKQDLLDEFSESNLDWHKEILFGLLLQLDKDELATLKERTNSTPVSSKTSGGSNGMTDENKILILPEIINNCLPTTSLGSKHDKLSSRIPTVYKRKDYSSCSLSKVEEKVNSRFRQCSLLQYQTGTYPDGKLFDIDRTSRSRKEGSNPFKNLTSCIRNSNSHHSSNFAPFSLLYNECSLAAISSWAAKSKCREKSNTMDKPFKYQPVPAPCYRKCNICTKFGHYDSECQSMKEKDIIHIANETSQQGSKQAQALENEFAQDKLPRKYPENSHPTDSNQSSASFTRGIEKQNHVGNICPVCNSHYDSEQYHTCRECGVKFQHSCVDKNNSFQRRHLCNICIAYDSDVSSIVEIEGCEGFVIEQYKSSAKMSNEHSKRYCSQFPNNEWSAAAMFSQIERDTMAHTVQNHREAQISGISQTGQIKKCRIKFTSTFHIKPLASTEVVCLDALTIPGFKKVKPIRAKKRHFFEKGSVYGLKSRPDDGALPVFSSPAVMCSKCEGFFPSHILTKIFYPPSVVLHTSGILTPPTTAFLPPLPWGISKVVRYVCGNCTDGDNSNSEGNIVIDENIKMTSKDRCIISLVNLMIIANPTHFSRTTPPAILKESKCKSPNGSLKYHQYFSADDVFDFLTERAEFFNHSKGSSKRHQIQSKKHVHNALRRLVRADLATSALGEDKNSYYSLTVKGFSHEGVLSRETLPPHVFSILDKFPTKPTIRASSIVKAHPETLIHWPQHDGNKHFSHKRRRSQSPKFENLSGKISNTERNEWDDIDITDDNQIVIFSKRDKKMPAVSPTDVARSSTGHNSVSRSIAQKIKVGLNKYYFDGEKQNNEAEEIPTFLEMPSTPEDWKGAIVAWELNENSNSHSAQAKNKKKSHKFLFGSVATEPLNGLVLVRTISNFEEIISFAAMARPKNQDPVREKRIRIGSCSLGASFWIATSSLNLVTKAPSSKTIETSKAALISSFEKRATGSNSNDINSNSRTSTQSSTRGRKRKANGGNSPFIDPTINPSIELNGHQIDEIAIHNSSRRATTAGIFQAEKILGERQTKVGNTMTSEYLIKWKGFGNEDNTWEPEKNILNPTLVSAYRTKQLIDKLKVTREAKMLDSPTFKILADLKRLKSELAVGYAKSRKEHNNRQCPFCHQSFKDGYGLGGHVSAHSEEPNYNLIRKAAKHITDEYSAGDHE